MKLTKVCHQSNIISSTRNKSSLQSETRSKTELSGTFKDLIGFVYDIPKDEQINNKQLTDIFKEQGLLCKAQIVRDESKPFYSARVKFETIVHL